MQNQPMPMGMNVNMGGPVGEGTPIMGNAQRAKDPQNSRTNLNTYIYDYFKRNNHLNLAQLMIDSDLEMSLQQQDTKRSPNPRNVNGVGPKDHLPEPMLPDHQLADNSFLMDWWCQFWDIWGAARSRSSNAKSMQYITHSRNLAQMQTEQRAQRLMMNNGMNAQYQNMMRGMPNGVNAANANDLKRAAAMNNRNPNGANPMANVNQMKNQAMMAQQMQRDGSQMDMNGQRPQSPGSTENAPSPNKRARVEGMNPAGMAGNQFTEFAQQSQGLQQKAMEGMNPAVQGSPMTQQGLDGHEGIFAGNAPQRPGMPAGAPGAPQGNHALQDYQMQLMLLEQQNKKRLLMARQEQDNMSGGPPQGHSGVGAPGYPPAMSPQGSRAGPSPNPTDQMKRGTPKMNQQGLPGSPMPDASMQQQRNSPVPFDPSQMPPGMPPQFAAGYPQMPGNPMMRPPSSHPGNFNGQMNQAQMEAMRRNPAMQNGWPQGGPPQAMMQNQGQPMGGPGGPMNPQQRNNMPPPPAPAGEQPRAEPSPSQPAAPPTPSQTNKANPKKKGTKDTGKKPANKKGSNSGANPAASSEDTAPTPTPSTPMTPVHPKSFNGPNGQPQAAPAPVQQPSAPPQQPPPMDNVSFGNLGDDNFNIDDLNGFQDNTLDNFDFDSFLHVGGDDPGFGLGSDFTFGDTAEVGDGI